MVVVLNGTNGTVTATAFVGDGTGITGLPRTWTETAVVSTASGTAFDFTSLPSDLSEIELYGVGVSLSGTDALLVQIGTGGTPTTSGYTSTSHSVAHSSGTSTVSTSTSGFVVKTTIAANACRFVVNLKRIYSTNQWFASVRGADGGSPGLSIIGAGGVTLSGVLDNLRLTRTGTNDFDAGDIFIRYR